MIEYILRILAAASEIFLIRAETAEERRREHDIRSFEEAVASGDDYTVNRLLSRLHSESGISATIDKEG